MRYCNWSQEYPEWKRCRKPAVPGTYRCEDHQTNKQGRRGGLTYAQKQFVREKFNFRCAICGKPAHEVDHIVEYHEFYDPREADKLDNLQLLCDEHHLEKTGRYRKSLIEEAGYFDRSTSARNRKKKKLRKQGFYRS